MNAKKELLFLQETYPYEIQTNNIGFMPRNI